uniref:Ig-like domain-containing protein n=1 Tax=Oryzias latipes TaxID=8090 RepID=A0A3B3IM06_ORYLA
MLVCFSVKEERLYKRVGEDVTLPCDVDRSYNNDVKWLISRPGKPGFERMSCKENVVQSSARASRLSVSSDCSLLIRNITDEDALQYVCRPGDYNTLDAVVYLNILSKKRSKKILKPQENSFSFSICCFLQLFKMSVVFLRGSLLILQQRLTFNLKQVKGGYELSRFYLITFSHSF